VPAPVKQIEIFPGLERSRPHHLDVNFISQATLEKDAIDTAIFDKSAIERSPITSSSIQTRKEMRQLLQRARLPKEWSDSTMLNDIASHKPHCKVAQNSHVNLTDLLSDPTI